METVQNVTLISAFVAGFLSFISPCVLPLVPSYLTFITGVSFVELTGDEAGLRRVRAGALIHAAFFVLGFSLVFTLMGASITFFGQILIQYRHWIRYIGGGIIILLGLFLAGLFKADFLMKEHRLEVRKRYLGVFGSFIMGLAFGAGWTPCIGPILASILLLASTQQSLGQGLGLLLTYSIGLGLPFIIAALAFNSFLTVFKRLKKHIGLINRICGGLLILIGVLLILDVI